MATVNRGVFFNRFFIDRVNPLIINEFDLVAAPVVAHCLFLLKTGYHVIYFASTVNIVLTGIVYNGNIKHTEEWNENIEIKGNKENIL